MSQQLSNDKAKSTEKAPPSLWKSIVYIIIFTFGIVALFGAILFLFISGGQQLGLSTTGYIAIFVVISAVFAWLVKRISDTASGMSRLWFPEESDGQD